MATAHVEAAFAQTTQSTEVPQASPKPHTKTAMCDIPVAEAEGPVLTEPEVSDLVVCVCRALPDLPGLIASQKQCSGHCRPPFFARH